MVSNCKPDEKSQIALVHDWLFGLRGGERCLQAFLCIYSDADIFALFYAAGKTDSIIDKRFRAASYLNRLPKIETFYRWLLPVFPLGKISELAAYPVRISLSHAASKNITGSKLGTRHICYCFTPMRYIWDQADQYLGWKSIFAKPLIQFLRAWDRRGAKEVTDFIAISSFVAARIRKYYGRRAKVIFPPVASLWIRSSKTKCPVSIAETESAYLFAGALVPYKGAALAIAACSALNRDLWVAGDGPDYDKLKKLAGPKVKFLGKVSDAELAYLLKHCKALVFPCKEDFGILPLEAQAAGKPVIALFAGACKQTILGCKHWLSANKNQPLASQSYTGVFIRKATEELQLKEVIAALHYFEANQEFFLEENCVRQAEKFSSASFYDSWLDFTKSCPDLCNLPVKSRDEFIEKFEGIRLEEIGSC